MIVRFVRSGLFIFKSKEIIIWSDSNGSSIIIFDNNPEINKLSMRTQANVCPLLWVGCVTKCTSSLDFKIKLICLT